MRVVKYTYRHPTIGVQEITLAQEGPADRDWTEPVGVQVIQRSDVAGFAYLLLDDEATRIVHPIIDRRVIGNAVGVWIKASLDRGTE